MCNTHTVILTNESYLPNSGGVQNSLYHLAHAFQTEGFRVIILTSDKNEKTHEKLRPYEQKAEAVILRYRYHRLFLIRTINAIVKMIKLKKLEQISSVVSRGITPSIASILIFPKISIYIIPSLANQTPPRYHDTGPRYHSTARKIKRYFKTRRAHILQGIVIRKSARVAVFSELMKRAVYSEFGRTDIEVLSPGVSAFRFSGPATNSQRTEERRKLHLPEDSTVLLIVARIVYQKRVDLAIEAMKLLPQSFHLAIVGSGRKEMRRLENLKENDSEIRNRIDFLGACNSPEKIYRVCDIFLLPSQYEPFGQTLLEAMACGMPIVAFDPRKCNIQTATTEVCPSFGMFLADSFSAASYAAAIQRAHQQKPDPVKISNWTHKQYCWENMARQITRKV